MDVLNNMEFGSSACSVVMVGVVTLLSIIYLRRREGRYPPGPFTLPILGNLHQIVLSGSIVKFCEKYRKIFGNVFSFEFGGNTRVVLSGYDAMHELLIKNADYTSSRSTNSFSRTIQEETKRNPGLFWATFPLWKMLRSFSLVMLRDGGMGKAAMEPQITEEVTQYIQHFIEPHLGQPISMYETLPKGTSNIISQLLFGRRFEYEDVSFKRMIEAINEIVVLSTKAPITNNIPFIKYFMKSSPLVRDRYLRKEVIWPTIKTLIDENRQTLDGDNPRCLIDQYMLSSEKEEGFTDGNAVILSWHLFVGGTETTSTTLRWALLYVCLYPDIMEKVQQEIDQHIGQRVISYKDHLNMPYTDAVLLETQRIGNVVNSALPHTVEKDMYICEKLIPAGADILLNMFSVLNDEEVFEEPDKFKPERYLTGDIALKKKRTIPFGIGRRACIAESLAKVEIFLFFVNFLQKYKVHLPAGSKVTVEPINTFISSPRPYDIVFTARQ